MKINLVTSGEEHLVILKTLNLPQAIHVLSNVSKNEHYEFCKKENIEVLDFDMSNPSIERLDILTDIYRLNFFPDVDFNEDECGQYYLYMSHTSIRTFNHFYEGKLTDLGNKLMRELKSREYITDRFGNDL